MKLTATGFIYGLLLSSFTTALVASELPAHDDYAYGFELTTRGDAGFFSVAIPIEVYRSVTDPKLRDAGVYNTDGQPVPRMIEHALAADIKTRQKTGLGLVPLYGQQAEQAEQLRLLLHQDSGGTTLELSAPKLDSGQLQGAVRAEQSEERILTAYIVDVRKPGPDLEALTFDWHPQPDGFIGRVKVETGDDLQNWRELGSATLAELVYENTRIEHRKLKLRTKLSDYLRITWQDMPASWSLKSMTGTYTGKRLPAAREWLSLDPDQPDETTREYFFDAGGYPPTDRVNVLLPDDNIVLRASVFHRRNGDDNWRLSHNSIFYHINREGNTVQTSPSVVPDTRASHWKVRIESGATTGPIRLQLGWRPDNLVFLAQGSPPYELVAGRAHDRLEQYPQERVLGDSSIFKMLRKSGKAGVATLGPRMIISGTDQLEIAATSRWRVLLLWAGLLAAIGLVAWLVYSLMRDMKQT